MSGRKGDGCCDCLINEVDRLRAELARVQRLPTLPEAQATSQLMQVAATLARRGDGDLALRIKDAVDGWRTSLRRDGG